jgi:hypothetical protein
MGRRRRDGNHSPQKRNSVQGSVGNEENGYPVPNLKKMTINVTRGHSYAHKKNPQRRNLGKKISEKFMQKILEVVNLNVQDALKKC